MPSLFYMGAPTRILCFPSALPNGCRYTEEWEGGGERQEGGNPGEKGVGGVQEAGK